MADVGYLEFPTPYTAPNGVVVKGIRVLPELTTFPNLEEAINPDTNSYRSLRRVVEQLHPDIRAHVSSALLELDRQGIHLDIQKGAANREIDRFGLGFSLTTADEGKSEIIAATMAKYGFVGDGEGHYGTTNDMAELEAIKQLPTVGIGPALDKEYWHVLPGGMIWNDMLEKAPPYIIERNIAQIDGVFGTDIGAGLTLAASPSPVATPHVEAPAPAAEAAPPAPSSPAEAKAAPETATTPPLPESAAGPTGTAYTAFSAPYIAPDGTEVAGLTAFPKTEVTPFTDEQVVAIGGEAAIRALERIHPDLSGRVADGMRTLAEQNIPVTLSVNTTDTPSLDNYGLAFTLTPTERGDASEYLKQQAAIRATMEAQGLHVAGIESGAIRFASTADEAEALAMEKLDKISTQSRFDPATQYEFPLIPGGKTWQENATPEHIAHIKATFGADVPPTDAAAAAATATTATPTSAPATVATDKERLALPYEKGTPVPAGVDKWTENGLTGLGIIKPDMTPEQRTEAIAKYLTDSGATDLAAQVKQDVIAVQTYLTAATIKRHVSTTTVEETKAYDIGATLFENGGKDGKWGNYTRAAWLQYADESGVTDPLQIIRPTPAAATDAKAETVDPTAAAYADPSRAKDVLTPVAAAYRDNKEITVAMRGITTDGTHHANGVVPEDGSATHARVTDPAAERARGSLVG